jgi:hypothetical protein
VEPLLLSAGYRIEFEDGIFDIGLGPEYLHLYFIDVVVVVCLTHA